MTFHLTTLSFKASPELPKDAAPITVLVGPNNSGKSMALREIMHWAEGDERDRHIIDQINVDWPPDVDAALAELAPYETTPTADEHQPANSILISIYRVDGNQERRWVEKNSLATQLSPNADTVWLRATVLKGFTARLDGRSRFELMQPQAFQDQQEPPKHHLAALFHSDDMRRRVREMVEKAFPGRYFVIDPTHGSQLRVRMSSRPPNDSAEERNWDERAVNFHGQATLIEELSDGLVSFAGLIAAAISLPHRILLVDEPEAFLHPPLARQLGFNLASLTQERGASLVAATHSAEFLMGCIASGVEVKIVRLTYEKETASVRALAPVELTNLIRDPLLRSTDALSGLFHRGTVVGESDHDRAFYEEINRRLVADDRGTPDTFFTNAQNWQTIPRIAGPLRKLGVPVAAIIDLDVICQSRREWNKFYEMANISQKTADELDSRRIAVRDDLKRLKVDSKHPGYKKIGIKRLSDYKRRKARRLFDDFAKYGVFVVEVGELEGWLSSAGLSAGRGKGNWIVKAFDHLGSDPSADGYTEPAKTDVWSFVDKVADWVNDPNRLGMPAAPN